MVPVARPGATEPYKALERAALAEGNALLAQGGNLAAPASPFSGIEVARPRAALPGVPPGRGRGRGGGRRGGGPRRGLLGGGLGGGALPGIGRGGGGIF